MKKTRLPLLMHQRPALAYARSTLHPALWMQMRLGKTRPTIRVIESYQPRSRDGRVRALVVGPGSALGDWRRELNAEGVPDCDIARLDGPRARRLSLLGRARAGGDIRWLLATKESWLAIPEVAGAARCNECSGRGWIRDDDERRTCTGCRGKGRHPGCFDSPEWDAVVADESTFLRSPDSRATRFYLSEFRDVPHRWSLTGLPDPEGILDYWCQLAWLDGRAFGCDSWHEFRALYFEQSDDGYGVEPLAGTAERVARAVAARAFVLRRCDAGVEPRVSRERREVEMPRRLRRSYDAAERDYLLELNGVEIDRTIHATSRWQWMRQMCGGFVNKKLVWPGKMRELTALLRGELRREKVVVWFAYNHEVDAALAAMRGVSVSAARVYGLESQRVRDGRVNEWRAGRTRVLLAQQAALDKGKDLSAADTSVYYSTHASGEMREQSDDRIVHPLKRRSLLIVDIIVPGTVDEDLVELLGVKRWRSSARLQRAVELRMRGRAA